MRHVSSRDKSKTLYLRYHNVYQCHQTCQDGDIPRGAAAREFT